MICNKQHPNVYCTINLDLLRIKEIQLKKVALYLAFQFIISFRSFKTLLKIHNSPRKFVLQGRSFLCQPENDEGEKSNTVLPLLLDTSIIRTALYYEQFVWSYPGYQRFFLGCDEELRRPQADTSSEFGFSRGSLFKTWPKPKTAHEKSPAPRVVWSQKCQKSYIPYLHNTNFGFQKRDVIHLHWYI